MTVRIITILFGGLLAVSCTSQQKGATRVGRLCDESTCEGTSWRGLSSDKQVFLATKAVVSKFLSGEISLCGRTMDDLRGANELWIPNPIKVLLKEDNLAKIDSLTEFNRPIRRIELGLIQPVLEGNHGSIVRLVCIVNGLGNRDDELYIDFIIWENGVVFILKDDKPVVDNHHTVFLQWKEIR